jgi:Zn-dependent protease with chaperone function
MNSKHCQIMLFLVYSILSTGFILLIMKTMGVPIRPAQFIVIIAGWILYCVGVGPYADTYYLFRHGKLRKPLLADEKLINTLFFEVQQKSPFKKTVRLWLIEDSGLDAFAIGTRTIAISKGALRILSPGEIKGIMAHELGHLETRDCRIAAAYAMAKKLPGFFLRPFDFITSRLKKGFLIILSFVCLLYFVYVQPFSKITHVMPLFIVTLFVLGYPIFLWLANFLWKITSRFREYRQDAFAHSLGFGQELMDALHKITLEADMPVNPYRNLMRDNHPIIYNRIRRLEKLLGLRDQ